MCILEEQETFVASLSNHSVSRGSVVPHVPTTRNEANELEAASASQKKIWISWKDKIEGTDRRKEERKPVQTKFKKHMISFFSNISRFATQTCDGGCYCGVVTKIEFKTKVHNYKHNWWLQR